MLTRYWNQALPTVLGVLVFLWGGVSVATQMPPISEDFDDLYIYTIPTLPLHENAALPAPSARISDSPGQHDADRHACPDAMSPANGRHESGGGIGIPRALERVTRAADGETARTPAETGDSSGKCGPQVRLASAPMPAGSA